jgi:hypothetical protein
MTGLTPKKTLADYGFKKMLIMMSATADKFDWDGLNRKFGEETRTVFTSRVTPEYLDKGEYNIDFFATKKKNQDVELSFTYHEGTKEHEKDEVPPYAEQFMEWVGQFFKYENTNAHIHARFEFSTEKKQCKFPLPLKTNIRGDTEDTIDGISLRFGSETEGVSTVRITTSKASFYIELIADRRITFKGYSPDIDVSAFAIALDSLFEEKKS